MDAFLEFKDKLDEEIVIEAKAGNNKAQEYLISKYENFVKTKAKSYFLIGADKEDKKIKQELVEAIKYIDEIDLNEQEQRKRA